jgi:hypothetical protein
MLLLTVACALACFDGSSALVEPRHATTQDSVVPPAPRTVTGSATVAVSIDRSRATATGKVTASTGTLEPQLSGSPQYDVNRGVVRLPVVLHNDGRLRIHAPADIYSEASGPQVHFANPDLVTRSGRAHWTFDRYLDGEVSGPTPRSRAFLPAHAASEIRWIEIAVPPNVPAFQTTLEASGTIVYTIAPHALTTTPDSVMRRAQADLFTHNEVPGHVTRDLVWLIFKRTATIEDRQEALDAVDGVVVGGGLLGAGNNYLVRILAPSDSGAGPLLRALDTLNKLPQVQSAFMHSYDKLTGMYLRPKDGSGFTSWQVLPQNATGSNWGEEAVAAPFAWGCSVGDSSMRVVADVDSRLYRLADFTGNLAPDTEATSADTEQHGTMVSSIIGAVGNNGKGLTGMLWNTQMGFFNTTKVQGTDSTLYQYLAMERAGDAGYSVINISLAIYWLKQFGRLPNPHSHSDSGVVNSVRRQIGAVIQDLRATNHYPLFVVASGDDGVDAFWSGVPAAKLDADYATQMIVVGSNNNNSSQKGTLSSFSDNGTLVDMVAPGNNVGVLDKSGSITTSFSGTSFSAPFVAGAAGLTATFDPTLDSASASTTTALKSLILQGAADGGRTAGGYPILNAYKSLRRAARKHGARLCDNLVYGQGNRTISVMRNDSTNDIETLVSNLLGEPYRIAPAHLGKYILYFADTLGDTLRSFPVVESFVNGKWQTTPSYGANAPDTLYAPAFQMADGEGEDHDGDHSVQLRQSGDSLNIYFDFSNTPSAAIVGGPCCNMPQAVMNAAGSEAWIAGYGFPIVNNDTLFNAYIYKVARAKSSQALLVDTIEQAQIFSLRETEDGSAFYVSLFFDSGGSQNTCNEDIADTTFHTLRVVSQVNVNSSLLCALKNMSESSMRIVQRGAGNRFRPRASQTKAKAVPPMSATRSDAQ